MATITVWLLVSIGYIGGHQGASTATIARFATSQECQRVRGVIGSSGASPSYVPDMRCIQATIVP